MSNGSTVVIQNCQVIKSNKIYTLRESLKGSTKDRTRLHELSCPSKRGGQYVFFTKKKQTKITKEGKNVMSIAQFPKIGLTHKKNPQWGRQLSQPTLLRASEARLTGASSKGGKCVELPPTFISGKRRKNRRKPVMKNISDSGVVFTFEEGISTSHVCLKGQQP